LVVAAVPLGQLGNAPASTAAHRLIEDPSACDATAFDPAPSNAIHFPRYPAQNRSGDARLDGHRGGRCADNRLRRAGLLMPMLLFGVLAPASLAHAQGVGAQTTVCRTITVDETWTPAASPYVVTCNSRIAGGVTLTVAPGTVVKFTSPSAGIVVDGTLQAQGTAQSPVILTSIKDDSVGGDTNNDGSASAPAAGDWGQRAARRQRQG
jgi:hypothetical protein